jgi:chemotaxis methyl-accepting protein methylase
LNRNRVFFKKQIYPILETPIIPLITEISFKLTELKKNTMAVFPKIKKKLKQTKLLILIRWINRKYQKLVSKKAKSFIQLANTTYFDRHPDLFNFAKEYFTQSENIEILSFGCSTGEECNSIASYFPKSNIKGYDINKKNIKIANLQNKSIYIEYFYVDILSDEQIIKNHKFNMIFALSVLCLEPEAKQLENINSLFSFEKFEEFIIKFYELLKKDGLLIIRNANYRVEDTLMADKFEPVLSGSTNFPIFNTSGEKNHGENKVTWVFKKI